MKYFTAVLMLACAVQVLAHSNGDITLAHGHSSSMGLVQVYNYGIWGSICVNRVNSAVDHVICRSLGFSDSRPLRFPIYSLIPQRVQMLREGIRCLGNESRLQQCEHGANFGNVRCGFNDQLAVDCYGRDIGSRVELRHGSSAENGILVLGNNHGEFGTMCDTYWSHANSIVACRMLGVDTSRFTPIELKPTYYGETTDLSDLSDRIELTCQGNETNLTQCDHRGTGGTMGSHCSHSVDVALDCHGSANMVVSLVNGNDTAGEVQVTYRGENGTACVTSSGAPAKVLCRMLGYGDSAGVVLDSREVTSSTAMKFYFSGCTGSEKSVAECGAKLFIGEMCNQALAIACQPQPDIAVRLVNGNATFGILEIQRNGQWGTICQQEKMTYRGVAAVVCRMLSLPTENAVATFSRAVTYKPAILYYVTCAGDEANLNQCYQKTDHDCYGRRSDAWISCA